METVQVPVTDRKNAMSIEDGNAFIFPVFNVSDYDQVDLFQSIGHIGTHIFLYVTLACHTCFLCAHHAVYTVLITPALHYQTDYILEWALKTCLHFRRAACQLAVRF